MGAGTKHVAGSARVSGARDELIKADELAATSQNLAHPQFPEPKLASCPSGIPCVREGSDLGQQSEVFRQVSRQSNNQFEGCRRLIVDR